MKIVVLTAVVAVMATAASAQDEQPRGFIGGGVAIASRDAGSRMRLFEDDPLHVWPIEGAMRVSSLISLGGEFIQPGAVRASTPGISFYSFGEQHERAVLGTMHVRVASTDFSSINTIVGAGVLYQRHELGSARCVTCEVIRTEIRTNRATAFTVGGDVPIRLADHVSIGVLARFYFLNRGNVVSSPNNFVPWQFEWQSSRRFGLGTAARVTW